MVRCNWRITIPNPHRGDDIDISLVRRIIRQAGIDPADWDNA
jgi:hypothetical protein